MENKNMIKELGGEWSVPRVRQEDVLGKKISRVENDGTPIVLHFEDGGKLIVDLEGDCCSRSYFSPEGLADAKQLEGSKILSVEEVGEASGMHGPYDHGHQDQSTLWHFLKFTTDKGHVTLDWRNDSNGYYDGWVESRYEEPKS